MLIGHALACSRTFEITLNPGRLIGTTEIYDYKEGLN